MKDGYQLFFERFDIDVEDLMRFEIEESISTELEVAWQEWERMKCTLNGQEKAPSYIRSSGLKASTSNLYLAVYAQVFPNVEIRIDSRNNTEPRKMITKYTKHRRTKQDTVMYTALMNYQVSHIFGYTKNPLAFTAPWNMVYLPKIIDPFSGHESKGAVTKKFTVQLRAFYFDKYQQLIEEFNAINASHR